MFLYRANVEIEDAWRRYRTIFYCYAYNLENAMNFVERHIRFHYPEGTRLYWTDITEETPREGLLL